MLQHDRTLSPQEKRIESGQRLGLASEQAQLERARIHRMLEGFREKPIHLNLARARLLTDSMKQTEGQPIVLRWARALAHILERHPILIREDELVVGSAGPHDRYAVFYPEVEGLFLQNAGEIQPSRGDDLLELTDEDAKLLEQEILPYWKDNNFHQAFVEALPEQTRNLISVFFVITPTATVRSSLAWCHDFEKVLKRGIEGIRTEAEQHLTELDPMEPRDTLEKKPFLDAVIIVCDAIVAFAERYADLALQLAEGESRPQRRDELRAIAEICRRVPRKPARSFHEAVQSQWLIQTVSRLEQRIGGVVGNGRIDQYLYPYFKQDKEQGLLTDDQALTLLESLWIGMARNAEIFGMPGNLSFTDGYAHWEATTIGGQTPEGHDATNELSYLMLQSKREFPLNYPDLSARIHSRTPESFLYAVCETIKEGTGFPKLFFDEEIVPLLLAKGAEVAEANDYCVAGCTEVKMVNRDTYTSGCAWLNLGAVVEMALRDGRLSRLGDSQLGVATGDARQFESYEQLWAAFRKQAEYLMQQVFVQQYVADRLKPRFLAAPMNSMLHDLAMAACTDLNDGPIANGLYLGSVDTLGFGTAIDSLAAIKKLVFDERRLTMAELLDAVNGNFEQREDIRQLCQRAPKYGNNDSFVDTIGYDIEALFTSIAEQHRTLYGGQLDIRYVSVTSHIPMGSVVGATPDGRKSGEPLAEGISPSQGADTVGPTATLLSIARTRVGGSKLRAARLLNMKLSPSSVAGRDGTRKLMALVRSACDLKTWHLQFNIINRETLLAAKAQPEKYRNLLVRVAGYSAFFVDLMPKLQDELIKRTEHTF